MEEQHDSHTHSCTHTHTHICLSTHSNTLRFGKLRIIFPEEVICWWLNCHTNTHTVVMYIPQTRINTTAHMHTLYTLYTEVRIITRACAYNTHTHTHKASHLYEDETWYDGVAAQGVVGRHLVSCRETSPLRIHGSSLCKDENIRCQRSASDNERN